ncbi:MAG: site-2 protease family protein [Chloroflexi bacterium]|nr:site-2 protease family protein [Chloroflexota bacterium]
MDEGTFKVARIGGIDIKVHWSLLIIVAMISFELAVGYFPMHVPSAGAPTYWALGLLTALLLFVSVLLHELSHSFVARAMGLPVRDITLFIFGGASNIEREPERARDEFLVAVVGPLTSLALAFLFFVLGQTVTSASQLGLSTLAVLHDLAYINLILGLFNLVPGFPLDGGRVLRSIIWAISGNFKTATRIAGFVGQLVAYAFIFWGVFQVFVSGDLGGLWIAFIGWFLLNAAGQSVAAVQMEDTLRGVTVGQVMGPTPEPAPPQVTLTYLLNHHVLPNNLRAVPVAHDGRFLGFVTLSDMQKVPQEEWGATRVVQVMAPAEGLPTAQPGEPLAPALQSLEESGLEQLPVLDGSDRLVGLLNRDDAIRWLQIRRSLKLDASAQR